MFYQNIVILYPIKTFKAKNQKRIGQKRLIYYKLFISIKKYHLSTYLMQNNLNYYLRYKNLMLNLLVITQYNIFIYINNSNFIIIQTLNNLRSQF